MRSSARSGIEVHGRHYYLASVAKGSYKSAAVAWAASPPNGGGANALEDALGWGSRFRLEPPSAKRPFPVFLLRARVKQFFSCSRPVQGSLNVLEANDVFDHDGINRTDGAADTIPTRSSGKTRRQLK